MNRSPIKSDLLKEVGYDAEKRLLEVQFQDRNGKAGAVYRYADVPPHIHEEFLRAESKGRYFATFIRACFVTTKVEEPKDASTSQASSDPWNSTPPEEQE